MTPKKRREFDNLLPEQKPTNESDVINAKVTMHEDNYDTVEAFQAGAVSTDFVENTTQDARKYLDQLNPPQNLQSLLRNPPRRHSRNQKQPRD
jgi:hypothetical protein